MIRIGVGPGTPGTGCVERAMGGFTRTQMFVVTCIFARLLIVVFLQRKSSRPSGYRLTGRLVSASPFIATFDDPGLLGCLTTGCLTTGPLPPLGDLL